MAFNGPRRSLRRMLSREYWPYEANAQQGGSVYVGRLSDETERSGITISGLSPGARDLRRGLPERSRQPDKDWHGQARTARGGESPRGLK